MKSIKRLEYLNGSGRDNHRKYYSQFVNEGVKRAVLQFIGKTALLKSKDEYLNDIPMKIWNALSGFVFRGNEMIVYPTNIDPVDIKLLREAEEGVSNATLVCIYKEAARQIIEELNNLNRKG